MSPDTLCCLGSEDSHLDMIDNIDHVMSWDIATYCNLLELRVGFKDLRLYRPHHQAGQAETLGQAN